jgi:hypothetical protein
MIAIATRTEQDEPREQHYVRRLEAMLALRGAFWCCWIRSLSLAGAGLEPAIPGALGEQVELRSPHFSFRGGLIGRVVNVASNRTSLAFKLDPASEQKLGLYLLTDFGRPPPRLASSGHARGE